MWRQRSFPTNADSDLSISDEEELSGNLGENDVFFAGNVGGTDLQLQSRLELLRGKDHVHSESKIGILKNETSVFEEDEVEMPDFLEEDGFMEDEIISNEEDNCETTDAKSFQKDNYAVNYQCAEQNEAYASSAAHKEAEKLICISDSISPSTSGFFKANQCRKGVMGKGKAKPKFSFHFQSRNNGGPCKSIICKDDDDNHTFTKFSDLPGQIISNVVPQEDIIGGNGELRKNSLPQVKAVGNSLVGHSMAEILDGLQDRNDIPQRISKMSCRTRQSRGKLVVKKGMPSLESSTVANEDQPELVSSGSSEDDDYDQKTKLSGLQMKKQSMAAQFHDALAATSLNVDGGVIIVPKLSCPGMFGKLQQVMQREKDHDSDFLKNLQREPISNSGGSQFIVVKILSKCLEGKLTVSHCSSVENMEGSQWLECSEAVINSGTQRKVIFNPRICSDVEIEVGNLIRIHYPWKEIRLQENDESVVLSAYFSQIFT